MALTPEEAAKATAIAKKLDELQTIIRNSLSLQAVGGSHIANELSGPIKAAKELADAEEVTEG